MNLETLVPSQYLHVAETSDVQPPLPVFSVKTNSVAAAAKPSLSHMYSVERASSPTGLELGARSLDDCAYMNTAVGKMSAKKSQSVDKLSHYVGMSGDSGPQTAETQNYVNDAVDTGVYSYVRTFNLSLPRSTATASFSSTTANGARSKLKKTSSTPNVLDAKLSGVSLPARSDGNTCGKDDYVPASPPIAAVSVASGRDMGATSTVLKLTVPSPAASDTGSPTDTQSPSIVSPVAGISMSTRSRVFSRKK